MRAPVCIKDRQLRAIICVGRTARIDIFMTSYFLERERERENVWNWNKFGWKSRAQGGPKDEGHKLNNNKKKKSKQKFEFLLFCDDDAPLFLWLSLIYTNFTPLEWKTWIIIQKTLLKYFVEKIDPRCFESMIRRVSSSISKICHSNLELKKKFNNCWCFPVKKK